MKVRFLDGAIQSIEYCCEKMRERHKYDGIVFRDSGASLEMEVGDCFEELEIDFCPWCGRKIYITSRKTPKPKRKESYSTGTMATCQTIKIINLGGGLWMGRD